MKKQWITMVSCMAVTCSCLALMLPASSPAAPWLAPAADEHITAPWVQAVAKALKGNRFKNIFMNQAFGCDQCAILGYLNDAAEALEGDEPKAARSFVRRALRVLDDGKELGWYSDRDIEPIKRVILRHAKKGFKESGAGQFAKSTPRQRGPDPRYEQGENPLFDRSGEDEYGMSESERWTGYTRGNRGGLTERLDQDTRQRRTDTMQRPHRQSRQQETSANDIGDSPYDQDSDWDYDLQ